MQIQNRAPRSFVRTLAGAMLIIVLLLLVSASVYWLFLGPVSKHESPKFPEGSKPFFYEGKSFQLQAYGEKEALKLPFTVVKDLLDRNMLYEKSSNSVIMTTKNKVVRLRTDKLTAMMNEKPFELNFPMEKHNGEIYLPISPLQELYGFRLVDRADTGAVMLFKQGDIIQWGKAAGKSPKGHTVPMRVKPSIRSAILVDLKPGSKVMIWGEKKGWYHVQLENGYTGYVKKSGIILDKAETVTSAKQEETFIPWKPVGGKINMTWEHVYSRNPKTGSIGEMNGLNVISPTWFSIRDDKGNIGNKADSSYVKWAHSRGYQVWALFSNGFEPDWTHTVLASYDTRIKMIKQLLSFAELYDLQGFNIDFENVYTKDKDSLTQFVRELMPLAHEQNLVISIDVTVKSNSEMWSLFYDRQALGELIDYMMVMAYDEHWAGDSEPGSVSSLSWAESGISRILEEDGVPASKLVLGVPYYTRIWSEKIQSNGKTKVTSKAVSMDAVNEILKKKKLKPVYSEETGQHYVEYKENGAVKKIWIEDSLSIKARATLVKDLGLAGIASWRRGFEESSIWDAISQTFDKRP